MKALISSSATCLVHLTDLAQFGAFNAIYEPRFPGVKPVRTTVRPISSAGCSSRSR